MRGGAEWRPGRFEQYVRPSARQTAAPIPYNIDVTPVALF